MNAAVARPTRQSARSRRAASGRGPAPRGAWLRLRAALGREAVTRRPAVGGPCRGGQCLASAAEFGGARNVRMTDMRRRSARLLTRKPVQRPMLGPAEAPQRRRRHTDFRRRGAERRQPCDCGRAARAPRRSDGALVEIRRCPDSLSVRISPENTSNQHVLPARDDGMSLSGCARTGSGPGSLGERKTSALSARILTRNGAPAARASAEPRRPSSQRPRRSARAAHLPFSLPRLACVAADTYMPHSRRPALDKLLNKSGAKRVASVKLRETSCFSIAQRMPMLSLRSFIRSVVRSFGHSKPFSLLFLPAALYFLRCSSLSARATFAPVVRSWLRPRSPSTRLRHLSICLRSLSILFHICRRHVEGMKQERK